MTGGAETPRSVLRLMTRLNIGGPARQALLLTRDMVPHFRTTLAAGLPTADEGELSDPAVPVRRVPLVRPVRPESDTRAFLAVRALLAETQAVLLHTHMAKAGTIGRSAALTMSPRPRTVHTFHGHVLDGYFGAGVQRAFVEVERRLARRTDVLIAVSAEVRDALLGLGIGRADQFRVVPLGFDLSSYLQVRGPSGSLRRDLALPADVPLVGIVGRLVPIKDHATLLAAMALLPGVHLAVIGDGELRSSLEHKARDSGLADRVHFTGWRTDTASVLSDLDVVVLTSRNEGTPVALIEAGASGRPVVATRVGGMAHVVEDGVTGYLVPPGDHQAIAAMLATLLADPHRRMRMGLAGRERMEIRFGQERLLRDMHDVYDDLCPPLAVGRGAP